MRTQYPEVRDHSFALNPYRKTLATFGMKYVFLMWHTGVLSVRAAFLLEDGHLYADPYLPDTRVVLISGGNVIRNDRQSYVIKWLPITKNTFKYF